jgi:ADP-heptose:LPS heptosyltransferase
MSRWQWQQVRYHQYLEVMPPLEVIKYLGKEDFSLMIVRDMGVGDVIICTDLAYNLKRAFPHSKITFATSERYKSLFNDLGFVDEVVTIGTVDPVDWDISVNLCGYCEQYPACAHYHRADLLGQAFGEFPWSEERGVHLTLSIEEEKWFEAFNSEYNPESKPVVALQPFGSSAHRSMQLESMIGLSRWLIGEGYHVYIYGQSPALDLVKSNKDLTILNECLELREILAIIKNSEFVVTPDSSGYHIAAAFDVPSFPAFTTIHEQVRVRDYNRCYPIRITDLNCSPCWDSPCGTKDTPCVTYLTAERLIEHIQKYRSQGYPYIRQPEYHPAIKVLK